tara:strand:- start:384 stop:626 length:243 start_codon:yes stop_codon:yes gene_type:complete
VLTEYYPLPPPLRDPPPRLPEDLEDPPPERLTEPDDLELPELLIDPEERREELDDLVLARDLVGVEVLLYDRDLVFELFL